MTPFPGGVGISGLHVYDWPAVDGVCGGTPHVHLTCSECYCVVGGTGSVQTLTPRGFASTPVREGSVVWFTPGTIHRLVNDGDLRIVVVMQNSGLPEAGDAVFTFPPEVLADPERYGVVSASGGEEAARSRRDLALAGFLALKEGGTEALWEFYAAALALKRGSLDSWEKRWRSGALASAELTGEHLDRLRSGDIGHLSEARAHVLEPEGPRRFGMCGRLDTYDAGDGRPVHG